MTDYLANLGAILFSFSLVFVLSYFYTQRTKFLAKKLNKQILYVALTLKLLSSIVFCYYYQSVYKAGDTLHYQSDASFLSERFLLDPSATYKEFILEQKLRAYSDSYHISRDHSFLGKKAASSKNMVIITAAFELLSFGNFYGTAILISFFAFTGLWKIYELICSYFKDYKKSLSLILFVPSVLFWTSGILKDSFVLGAICWVVFSVFTLFKKNHDWMWSILVLLLGLVLIVSLKPYALVVLIPTLMIGVFVECLRRVKNRLTSVLLLPILLAVLLFLSISIMGFIQGDLVIYGEYGKLLEFSSSVKKGFDETVGAEAIRLEAFDINQPLELFSMISSVLFRPFVWESWNFISFISSVENFIILLLTMLAITGTLFKFDSLKAITKEPFLIFCLFYSISFAIGLGASISNFGALVRFKSAFLIFYLIPIIIIIEELRRNLKNVEIQKKAS